MVIIRIVDEGRHAHDTIDGETVVIDTITGRLTLLVGSATTVWDMFVAGAEPAGIVADAHERFGPSAAAEVGALIEELIAREMLATVEVDRAPGRPAWSTEFATPRLEAFDEISDIMTMDPIHEVDVAEGWPRRR